MNAQSPAAPEHALSVAALNGEAILRAMTGRSFPFANDKDIAAAAGRPTKNITREIDTLETAGLVGRHQDGRRLLTPAGVAAVAALDRAAGADAGQGGEQRAPHGDFLPNPLNPREDMGDLDGLAASIEANDDGDLIEPVVATPANADGKRYLLAGERRWRATAILIEAGSAAKVAVEGLPFIERAATPAQALFIAVVENSQREGLTPWEDAQGLLALQKETGWSARDLAFRIGRAKPGSESGVKDVQDKIRIARHAKPEAVAAYLSDGSWERLRESAFAPVDPASDDPLVVNGRRYPNLTRANEARRIAAGEGGAGTPARKAEDPVLPLALSSRGAPPTPDKIELSGAEELVLIEIAHKTSHAPHAVVGEGKDAVPYAQVGAYWLDLRATRLQSARLIVFRQVGVPQVALTLEGVYWLEAHGRSLPITTPYLSNAQLRQLATPDNMTDVYSTPWLEPRLIEAGQQGEEQDPPAALQTDLEHEPEDPQVAIDRATLADVQAAIADAQPPLTMLRLADLLRCCGNVALPLRAGEGELAGELIDANGEIVLSVDAMRENTEPRAQAIATIFAFVVNNALHPHPEAADEGDAEIPSFLRRLAGAEGREG